ncbi:MAG: 50S ribosomal protein L11 methyltransferase [Verrucomicrobiales bacterium]|nr:50S ribosomal protein L11 methyltransferase [Verrucomicrobiales bacterium]
MDASPLFRWSKWVPEAQLDTWEETLTLEGIPYTAEKAVARERWQISVYEADRTALEALRERFGGGVVRVRPEDWQPAAGGDEVRLKIRDRFVVVEEMEPADLQRIAAEHPGREILSFPPQMAFGTGSHQTTATCLRQLVDESTRLQPGEWDFLDLGSGSGILAVAARKLGAREVVAVENDPLALEVARENARRHGEAEAIEYVEGDAIAWCETAARSGRRFRVVAANLFADLLVTLMPRLPGVMSPDGILIVSGFLTSQARSVNEAAKAAGIDLTLFLRRGKWVTSVGRPG